jgi:hypothetical protein
MPNSKYEIKNVTRLIGSWIMEVELSNALYYYDINKVSALLQGRPATAKT